MAIVKVSVTLAPHFTPICSGAAFLFPHFGQVYHKVATKNDPGCESAQPGSQATEHSLRVEAPWRWCCLRRFTLGCCGVPFGYESRASQSTRPGHRCRFRESCSCDDALNETFFGFHDPDPRSVNVLALLPACIKHDGAFGLVFGNGVDFLKNCGRLGHELWRGCLNLLGH